MSLYSHSSTPMPSPSVTNDDRTLVVPSVMSSAVGSVSFPAPRSTLFLRRRRGTTCTARPSSTPPGRAALTDASFLPSSHLQADKDHSTTYQRSSNTFGIAAIPCESPYPSQSGTSLGDSTSISIMSLSQSARNDASMTVTPSYPSQSPSQINTSSNQSGHTTSTGLIVALTLVGGLLVALMTYLTLCCRRRIRRRRRRASSPLIHSVLSAKASALSPPGGFKSTASRSTSSSMATVIKSSGDHSAYPSTGVTPARDSSSNVRFSRTPPSSKIGLAL
ncbi:hypothetical protein EDC04DRAFT_158004 [Pisolithus marmoratus]|nr:hypothetical protein EDC04DRAFT_158004 [Pisolithus marmoratus]